MWNWALLATLIGFGVYDLVLVFKKKDTLSQRYHRLLPQWADYAVMIALLAGIAWNTPDARFVYCLFGVVLGHLLWFEKG